MVAPPSRHASGQAYQWAPGRDLDTSPGQVPVALLERLLTHQRQQPTGRLQLRTVAEGPGGRYARAALAKELARVAAAPVGHRNRQLWESTRNLYNLVATGALDHREVDHALLAAAERCGLLAEEPRQTHRTLASGRQVGLAHPGRPRQPTSAERIHPSPPRPARAAGERTKRGGEGHGRRPSGRPDLIRGVGACRQAEPAPTRPPHRGGPLAWAAVKP